jgi:hypothetical protein
LFFAGEKPKFLQKAGFKLPVSNPPEAKTGGLKAGSDHGSVASEEEDVPRRFRTSVKELAVDDSSESEDGDEEAAGEAEAEPEAEAEVADDDVIEILSSRLGRLTTQSSQSIMRYNLAQNTVSIRNPSVVSGYETRKRLILIVHCDSGVPTDGTGIEMKFNVTSNTVKVWVPIDDGLFNAHTIFAEKFEIAADSPSIGSIQEALSKDLLKHEKNSIGQPCQTFSFTPPFPVEESFRMWGTHKVPEAHEDPVAMCVVRNPTDRRAASWLAVGFLLGQRDGCTKMIEAKTAAVKKTVLGIQSSGLHASPARPTPAPFAAGLPSPSRRPKRPRNVQFPTAAPLPDASPSSQTFLDANMESESNLNNSNETDDASFIPRFM